jgi:para-nitrobenzyl esterase
VYPSPVEEAIRSGAGASVQLVLGATDQEFSLALADQREAVAPVPASVVLERAGLSPETIDAYLDGRQGDTADVIGQYITDITFRTVALGLARARQGAPTWLYRFAWVSPSQGSACHCLDVPFFFDCLGSERVGHLAGENPPQALADDVHGAAVRFIASGDPGWERFDGESARAWVFDTPSHAESNAYADVDPLLEAPAD